MEQEPPINKAFLDEIFEKLTPKFDDAHLPTEKERQVLARLMYMAFLDLRILAREGRNGQACALADTFHNVPLLMHRQEFSFRAFRDFLTGYQERFQGKLLTNFLNELDRLNANLNLP